MAKEEQNRVLDLIEQVTGNVLQRESCPDWLVRPGRIECGQDWDIVKGVYRGLTGATSSRKDAASRMAQS